MLVIVPVWEGVPEKEGMLWMDPPEGSAQNLIPMSTVRSGGSGGGGDGLGGGGDGLGGGGDGGGSAGG